jgi:hypothetical protein
MYSVRSHTSSWRSLLAFAPVLGVVFVGIGLVQGQTDIAMSRPVHVVIAVVALVGWWAAWRLAKVAGTPTVAIAQAQPGFVALRGRAEALRDAHLVTPSGTPCVWYRYSTKPGQFRRPNHTHDYTASESMTPFFLVDDAGAKCIVLPDGAEVDGGKVVPDTDDRERFIAEGDRIFVAGAFEATSLDGIDRVRKAFEKAAAEPQIVVTRGTGDEGREQARTEMDRRVAENAKPRLPPSVPALPIIAAPRVAGAFVITAKDGETESGLYGLVQKVNLLVFVAALGMATWLTLHPLD